MGTRCAFTRVGFLFRDGFANGDKMRIHSSWDGFATRVGFLFRDGFANGDKMRIHSSWVFVPGRGCEWGQDAQGLGLHVDLNRQVSAASLMATPNPPIRLRRALYYLLTFYLKLFISKAGLDSAAVSLIFWHIASAVFCAVTHADNGVDVDGSFIRVKLARLLGRKHVRSSRQMRFGSLLLIDILLLMQVGFLFREKLRIF
jgi:hypothetical protein